MLDHSRAALRRLLAAATLFHGGAGDTGSEAEGECAHRVSGATLMLNVGLVRRGAHGDGQNSSPELVRAAVLSGCRCWRRLGPR